MATVRYLRQLKTGTIYVYTDILARRRDMVPYDENEAKTRIHAIKNILASRESDPVEGAVMSKKAEAVKAAAMELTGLEATLEANERAEEKAIEDAGLPEKGKKLNDETPVTSEEVAEQVKQDRLDQDPKYKKAVSLKSKNDVEEYMLLEFGQEIEISRPFKALKAYAVAQTAIRILEE